MNWFKDSVEFLVSAWMGINTAAFYAVFFTVVVVGFFMFYGKGKGKD